MNYDAFILCENDYRFWRIYMDGADPEVVEEEIRKVREEQAKQPPTPLFDILPVKIPPIKF